MELDNLKQSWQEAEIKPTINECQIQQMIDNKGKSAFSSILRYEKLGFCIAALCIPLAFVVFKEHILIIFYLISICFALAWQTYKYRFLKTIDFSRMSILEISTSIAKYKKYISREFIAGMVWAFVFAGIWVFSVVLKDMLKTSLSPTLQILVPIGLFILMVGFVTLVAWGLYRAMYIANIKKIEQSIKEIQEFEKEED